MRLGIMQPYIFPYIGYYQLINSVDRIVMYDDVTFIKQGWINRNRILINGKDFLFAVPLKDISSNKFIRDTLIDHSKYELWSKKFLSTIAQNYKKAPFFDNTYNIIESILNGRPLNISELAVRSLKTTSGYLGLKTEFIDSSIIYNNQHLKGQERVLDICSKEQAIHYINAAGGQDLYSKSDFLKKGIKLNFISSKQIFYKQFKNDFVPWLSIIDFMMFNSVDQILEFVNSYDLI